MKNSPSFFSNLKRRSLSFKINLIVLLAMVGVCSLLIVALNNSYKDLLNTKKGELNHLVSVAFSTVASYHQRELAGEFSREEAQKRAKFALSHFRYQGENYFWVTDKFPKMIMHPIKPHLDGKDLSGVKDPNGTKLFVAFVDATKKSGSGYVDYMWPKPGYEEPLAKIAYVKNFAAWGWVIGTGSYIDDIEALYWSNVMSLLLVAFAIFVIVLTGSLLLARSIVRPMKDMTSAMLKLSKGDVNVQISSEDRGDEIGQMGRALKVFQENAVERIRLSEEQENQKLAARNERRAAFMTMADHFDKEVRSIVTSVSNSALNLKSMSEDVAVSTEENVNSASAIASAMDTTSQNVETVARASQEMSSSITEISEQMVQSNEVSQVAVSEVKKANEVIEGLSESSQAIGSIVQLIQEIAEQTNLLALNATIEAARAGDAGKGFAVVASEVKELATQTGKATEDISGQVDQIQGSISKAVVAIDHVNSTIEKLNSISGSIAAAVEEQGYASGEISSNIVETSDLTRKVHHNTAELNGIAERNGQSANGMINAVSELNQEVLNLQTHVDDFVGSIRAQNG